MLTRLKCWYARAKYCSVLFKDFLPRTKVLVDRNVPWLYKVLVKLARPRKIHELAVPGTRYDYVIVHGRFYKGNVSAFARAMTELGLLILVDPEPLLLAQTRRKFICVFEHVLPDGHNIYEFERIGD